MNSNRVTVETDTKPNQYCASAMLIGMAVMGCMLVLSELGIFKIDRTTMRIAALFCAAVCLIPQYIIRNKRISESPHAKYLIILCAILVTFITVSTLNFHAQLVLSLPLFLAAQYPSRSVARFSVIFVILAAVFAPIIGYVSGYWDISFLLYMAHMANSLVPLEATVYSVDMVNIKDIFLFISLPSVLVVISFGQIVGYIVQIGISNIKNQQEIIRLGETDVLTGLLNRNSFERKIGFYPAVCDNSIGCAYLDANGLHEINNTKGHEAGDYMLKEIARILKDNCDKEDVYRVGGDEFIAVFKDETLENVDEIMSKVSKEITEQGYYVSVGTAVMKARGDVEELVKSAERRMYEDKRRFYEDKSRDRRQRSTVPIQSMDATTGLYSKEYFCSLIENTLYANDKTDYVLVVTDINNFKLFNDVFGHKVGDEYLRKLGGLLRTFTAPEQICGRLGDDHLIALVEKNKFNEQDFKDNVLCGPSMQLESGYSASLCAGVYEIVDRNITASLMCDRALLACHSAKGDFRENVAYYNDDMRQEAIREQQLIAEIKNAIAQDQFDIYLQPQVTSEGIVLGAEALARWKHPEKGIIPPNVFIPVCEKHGIISQLDKIVWEKACRQLLRWQMQGLTSLYISINISPIDLYQINAYETITGLVQKYNIDPSRLNLEITETAVMMDLDRQIEIISKFQAAGFTVEMDDFGSGYSSLSMLKSIRVNVLKLDLSFISNELDYSRGKSILTTIIRLARDLEMRLIVEGVESLEQKNYLERLGCSVFQGFLFSPPLPVKDFEKMIGLL